MILWDKILKEEVPLWFTCNKGETWLAVHPESFGNMGVVKIDLNRHELREEFDPLFYKAGWYSLTRQWGNAPMLQRRLMIGYKRSLKILNQLEREGVLSEVKGFKKREILMTQKDFIEKFKDYAPSSLEDGYNPEEEL